MIGFCTAPSRESATESSTVSMRVGSCQLTRVPARTPRAKSPAATRSQRSRKPANVIRRSFPSAYIRRSGVRSARRQRSSQKVGASTIPAVPADFPYRATSDDVPTTMGTPWRIAYSARGPDRSGHRTQAWVARGASVGRRVRLRAGSRSGHPRSGCGPRRRRILWSDGAARKPHASRSGLRCAPGPRPSRPTRGGRRSRVGFRRGARALCSERPRLRGRPEPQRETGRPPRHAGPPGRCP